MSSTRDRTSATRGAAIPEARTAAPLLTDPPADLATSRRFAMGDEIPDGPLGARLWTHAEHAQRWHPGEESDDGRTRPGG